MTTGYGQKIMLQFLEDYLRRIPATELFANSYTDPTQFIKVVRLQVVMISEG